MTYQEINNELGTIAEKSIKIASQLNEQLTKNMQQFLGEKLAEENSRIDQIAKAELKEMTDKAQEKLNTGLEEIQKELDSRYFADINVNQAAELEMVAKSDITFDEIKAYFRKFSGNHTALRRLEKLAISQGYIVRGCSYTKEIEFLERFKNTAQSLVKAIPTGELTRLRVAINYLNGKIQEYETFSNQEVQVMRGAQGTANY
ncbi:hypothetical protein BH747_04045 [Enterococcus villorum]|uniref:Uncharacterized protein n=1 Tax=Enterococcus villorum TaxID=112904 RepID=A0A1V8YQW2_9ENTE|nr:hypothetical protein [Enterococcus villorum]OQO71169.1 hypothetical protein BH747_04045 [Enterococcus villorum]OQO75001.1 hypothetical protein BH744_06365 [Enterococcus villorum]